METAATEPWYRVSLGQETLRYLANYFAVQSLVVALFVAAFYFYWDFEFPQRLIAIFLPLQLLCTAAAFRLAYTAQMVQTKNYLLLLLMSVGLLVWFLHDSGGHTNPLISLLLVPLAMSAALLGWQASVIIALVVVAAYAGLMNFYVPLGDAEMSGHHHHHDSNSQLAQLHLYGMWLTFCLSALLILVLVIPLASSIRKQREYIARQREQALQDERLVAMATFAASAAHQLGTPLSTLSVLAEDLAEEFKQEDVVQEDLSLMAEQIQLCKKTLHSMMQRADAIRNQSYEIVSLMDLIPKISSQFNLLNPAYVLSVKTDIPESVFLKSDETLEQAILNLLDNAARAGEDNPALEIDTNEEDVCLRILDVGPGFSASVLQNVGQPFISTREKNEGMGLGLFLSNATINRLGGSLKLFTADTGSIAEVWLPKASPQDSVGA
ncbi:MAG: ATP-binding protein [Pseudomonadales bacterium]|nr:ATP-binding protein [Pseudomonadales bacterium]